MDIWTQGTSSSLAQCNKHLRLALPYWITDW